MADKTTQIKLKNVYKCYQDAESQKTKDFLSQLFPDLDKRIQPYKKSGWVKGRKINNGEDYEFLKVKGHEVEKSFIIDQRLVGYNYKIRVKHLPIIFLKDIEYFTEEE